jgi:hypothetical protein
MKVLTSNTPTSAEGMESKQIALAQHMRLPITPNMAR